MPVRLLRIRWAVRVRRGCFLRRCQVAGNVILRYGIDNDFVGSVRTANVELDWFVECIGIVLGVNLAELELDRTDLLRLFGFDKTKFVNVPFAEALQFLYFFMIAGD